MATSTADAHTPSSGCVVCCGLTTLDLAFRVNELPSGNSKVAATGWGLDVGGPAANAARTIAALGGCAHLVTALGAGPLSWYVRQRLDQEGVNLSDCAPAVHQLPVSAVAVDRDGSRAVISANALGLAALPVLPLGSPAALLVDGHLPGLQREFAGAAQASGVPVILDGGSYKPGTEELLKLVSIAALSADFTLPGLDPSHPGLLAAVRAHGPGAALRTDGPRPILLLTAAGAAEVPVPPARVRDTLGAGDVFHGALALGIARGLSLSASVAYAAQIGSRSVEHDGALGWAAT